MSIGVKAAVAKYGPVVIGVVLGSAAKYGRALALGEPITKRQIIGHFMMMGVVGLAASMAVNVAGITDPSAVAFASAVFAIASNDIVKYIATRAWKRFFQESDQILGDLRNEVQAHASASELINHAKGDRK